MGSFYISAAFASVALYYLFFKKPDMVSVVSQQMNTTYDYIIVGAGTAGPVLAARLSEDPDVNVLLLEAGGDYTETEEYHIPILYQNLQLSSSDWQYFTVPQASSSLGLKEHRSFWPKGRVLGGSNLFNALQYSRGSQHDYDEWKTMGAEGWGYEDVLPYFLKSEDMNIDSLRSSKYHNTGGPIAVSSSSVTPFADVLMQAGKQMGYKEVDNNGETQEGFSINQINVRDGVRSSSALEFLTRAQGRNNLHISINSFVTKVVIENKKATGVNLIKNGRKRFINVRKEVILCAGAINSPQLLMLSGIGPRKHLESVGIKVVADLPVGENLQDHLIVIARSTINKDMAITPAKRSSWKTQLQYNLFGSGVLASSGNEVTAFMCTQRNHSENCAADIQFMINSQYCSVQSNKHHFADDILHELCSSHTRTGFNTVVCLLDPKSVGTIKLKSPDPFDHPLIDPGYLTDQQDIAGFIRGMRLLEKFMMTPSMQNLGVNFDNVRLSRCSMHEFRSDKYWECFIRHTAVTCYHPAGTCKMGKSDDKTAVVDPYLKVIGLNSIRVVDASVMPNVISGNTNAPVTMIAEKAADIIRGKDTVRDLRARLQNV